MNKYTWYCPKHGLEHRMLDAVGWQVEHELIVDGKPWVKLVKREDSRVDLSCLN
jgi:hypothetical protein